MHSVTELISSDIWWSLDAYCLSCEGRHPALPSEGEESQPRHKVYSSSYILSITAFFYANCSPNLHFLTLSVCLSFACFVPIAFSIPLTIHLSREHCKIIMLRLACCDPFSTHLPLPSPPSPCKTHKWI